ncbi:MAG: glucoamylase family protein [Saprospiraceae bacterium]
MQKHHCWLFCLAFLFPILTVHAQQSLPSIGAEKPPFSLDELEKRTFFWFWDLAYAGNYQIPDRYPTEDFSSIAATGFGLTAYIIGAERGWVTREQAAERVLKTLEVLKSLPQGPDATGVAGYRGFFYHFLDVKTALRFKNVELSSIDTGLLMAGVLAVMSYFDKENATEKGIRETADALYRRVEWDWFLNAKNRLSMGWFPERGFLNAEWRGYNEAMVLLLMAIGSPTHPAPPEMWDSWCDTYYRTKFEGQDMVNFGPLFGHQYSQMFVDFRGIRDKYMKTAGWDYFENSRRATLANRSYCLKNPGKFTGYGPNIWGLTACDGPFDGQKTFNGKASQFQTYSARGVAADYLVDDGTIAPTAVGGSVPFAPEVCLPALEAMWNRFPVGKYGFFDAYNETFTDANSWQKGQPGHPFWVDVDYLGIDQGPILIQIENHRTGLIWNVLRKNKYIVAGLKRAGFTGGWLDTVDGGRLTEDGKTATTNRPPSTVRRPPSDEVPLDPPGFFRREMYVDAAGHELPYQLMPPQAVGGRRRMADGKSSSVEDSVRRQPLVVFLHGSGERGHQNHEQMRNGVFAFCEKENLKRHACWLLVPQCPENDRWASATREPDKTHFYPDSMAVPGKMVIELVEKLLRENPAIDPDRVYLTGLSMGGFGTFDLLMRRPDLFAAAVPVCGGGDPAFADRIKHIPMWIFHGRLDPVVSSKYSEQMYDALKKAGAKVRYTEFSTLYHDIWNQVYYNPEMMKWLFAQRRGGRR